MKKTIRGFIDDTLYIRRCAFSLMEALKDSDLNSPELEEALDDLENDCNITLAAYRRVIRSIPDEVTQ